MDAVAGERVIDAGESVSDRDREPGASNSAGPLEAQAGESLDRLSPTLSVLQRSRGHRSATDDILAAWVAWTARPQATRVLDLGCGHGTVTLHLSQVLPEATFVSVEVQAVSVDLARRNVALNGLSSRVRIVEQDLRTLELSEADEGFDMATGTPPFMPRGSGVLSADPQRAAARFELRGGIEAYCATAARMVRPGGCVSMLMDAAQDARCQEAFRGSGLRLDRVVVVTPRAGKSPRFRGYVGVRGPGAEAAVAVVEDLVVRDESGNYTARMQEIRRQLFLCRPGDG